MSKLKVPSSLSVNRSQSRIKTVIKEENSEDENGIKYTSDFYENDTELHRDSVELGIVSRSKGRGSRL